MTIRKRYAVPIIAILVLWVVGLASNYYVAASVEQELRKEITGAFLSLKESVPSGNPFHRHAPLENPEELPSTVPWLSRDELVLTYFDADHYEVPFNNAKGYLSFPRPFIVRYGWYVPVKTRMGKPWAYVVPRNTWIPFHVHIEYGYQFGPLAGFTGYRSCWRVFGLHLTRDEYGIIRLS